MGHLKKRGSRTTCWWAYLSPRKAATSAKPNWQTFSRMTHQGFMPQHQKEPGDDHRTRGTAESSPQTEQREVNARWPSDVTLTQLHSNATTGLVTGEVRSEPMFSPLQQAPQGLEGVHLVAPEEVPEGVVVPERQDV